MAKQWEISVEVLTEEKTQVKNLWHETPPVWKLPPFELGEVSPEALTELTAKLVNQAAVIHDVTTERFLAMANVLAYKNPESARNSLRGLRRAEHLLYFAQCFAKSEEPGYGFDTGKKSGIQDPLSARLPVLWPMLTEGTKKAGALTASGESPPVWVNRILDIALRYAPYLKEAAKRGLIGAEDAKWTGLCEIASSKAKSTAVGKAKELITVFGEAQ